MSEKFEAPSVGADVNYVAPGSLKISKVKAIAVAGEGRIVTVEVPTVAQNKDGDEVATVKKVTAVYREKSKLAGNTWHYALLMLLLHLAFSLQPSAFAALPTYHTLSGYGNAATPAGVIFPADPNSQIRVVTIYFTEDWTNGTMNFQSGTTAYSLVATNSGMVTNIITATNGLAASTTIFLQHNGSTYTNTASSWGNTGTNGYTQAGVTVTNTTTTWGTYGTGPAGLTATNLNYLVQASAWPVNASAGDEIYIGGTVTSIPLGMASTNQMNGDDIFTGNYGQPVIVTITPAYATNRLSSISAHYDSQSQ